MNEAPEKKRTSRGTWIAGILLGIVLAISLIVVSTAPLFAKQNIIEGTYAVGSHGGMYWFTLEIDDEWTMFYEIQSDTPINVYVLTARQHANHKSGLPRDYVEQNPNIYSISGECELSGSSVLLMVNENPNRDATVKVVIDGGRP